MGGNCCISESNEPNYMQESEGAVIRSPIKMKREASQQLKRRSKMQNKIDLTGDFKIESFTSHYAVQGLVYESRSGLYENYICTKRNLKEDSEYNREGGPKSRTKGNLYLLQSIKIDEKNLKQADSKLKTLINLEPSIVEPLIKAFYSDGNLFLINRYIDQGRSDLFFLANMRQSFSEAEIGKIASQLLNQLLHLHEHGIYCKYLCPQHIIVTKGMTFMDGQIELRITDIAIL